jgi:hypothetical protein
MKNYKKIRNTLMALLGVVMFCVTSCKEEDFGSDARDIISFTVDGEAWDIDSTNVITHTYPAGTDVTALTPTITVSEGATVSPASGVTRDFSAAAGVSYWVTAADGSTKKQYIVKVTVLLSPADILSFTVGGEAWTISGTNITKTFPNGTPQTNLTPTITVSEGATVAPASGVAQNFFTAAGVTYTVTGLDGKTTKSYTAKATVALPNACDITAFAVGGEDWTIDGTNITKTFPNGTDVTALEPTITVSAGATVDPASGEAQDFSAAEGVVYTVTAADGTTTKTYTAKAIVEDIPLSGTTGDCTWALSGEEGNYTLTISGNGAMGDIDEDNPIPWSDFIDGIKTVIVADGVTRIGNGVFVEHQNVVSATIPNSVTSIGSDFFVRGRNLTSVDISTGLTAISNGFLFKCSKLTSVTIPAGVQSIGEAAFVDCLSLETVTCLNPTPPTLSGVVFRPNDEGEPDPAVCILKVPAESVQAYKDSDWGQLERFEDIVGIGASNPISGTTGDCTWTLTGEEDNYTLTISGNGAMGENTWQEFFGWTEDEPYADYSGIKTVVVEAGVTALESIGNFGKMTSITLPSSVTSLGSGFLTHCETFAGPFTIPNGVESLGWGAISWCFNLTSVTIPSSVNEVGEAAFADCFSLETVICLNPVPPTFPENSSGQFRFGQAGDAAEPFCILRVPAESVQAYKDSDWGKLEKFADIVAIE